MIKVKIYILLFVLVSTCLPLYSQGETDSSVLADSVMLNDSLANYYGEMGDLSKAQEYAFNNVAINSVFGEYSVPYAVAVLKYARYLYPDERDKDDELSIKGLSILEDSLGTKSSVFIKYLLEYAWRQFNHGQIHEACKTIKETAEEDYDDESYLGDLYYSYSHFLKELREIENSKTFALKAKSFYENKRMYDDDRYLKTLNDLAMLNITDQDLSIDYLNEVQKIIKKNKGENCIDYLDVLLDKANVYRLNNNMEKALEFASQAKEIGEKIKDLDYGSYLYTLEFLAGRYSSLKQYDKAIILAEECLNLMKQSKEFALKDRLTTLDSLIVYYSSIANVERINLYAKEAYLIRKNLNISGMDMVVNLFYLLHSNYKLGKYEECEANINETKAIYGDTYSTNYKHYYEDMEILMHSFFIRKKYKDALDVSNELEVTYLKQFGEENEYLANIYSIRANIYTYLGDMDKYHDYSLKALDIIKNTFGDNSPKYLSEMCKLANSFYNMGYYPQSYSLFKESAYIASNLYGKGHAFFVTNFLSALLLWDKEEEKLFDDYKLDDLYHFFLFQRIIYDINNHKQKQNEKMKDYQYFFLEATLPILLDKYNKDPISIKAIYNSLLLSKNKLDDAESFKAMVSEELGQERKSIFLELCKTNSAYILMQANSVPEKMDSLFNKANQYVELLSKESTSFSNYMKEIVTVDSLVNNIQDNDVIIDYIPLRHLGDGYVDYLVVLDKQKMTPDFISITNGAEQVEQLCSLYNTKYFLIDNDSILSSLEIDIKRPNCIIGYNSSINYIFSREEKKLAEFLEPINQAHIIKDDLKSAYNEFEKGVKLYNKKDYARAIKFFYLCDSLVNVAKGKNSNYWGHGMQWIASCLHILGNDTIAEMYSEYYYLPPIDMRQTVLSDSILDIASSLYDSGNKKEALEKYIVASKIEKVKLGNNSYWYANTISRCADICNELEKYEKAFDYEMEAIKIREKNPGINHIDYYWSLENMFKICIGLGNLKQLLYYGEKLIKYMEEHKKIIGWQYNFYTHYTSTVARLFAIENDSLKASYYSKKALDTVDSVIDVPEYYAKSYYDIIFALNKIGEDSLTFELCKKMLSYYESNEDKQLDQDDYSNILILLSNHYYEQEDFITASLYMERALSKAEDKKSINYGIALSNLSLSYIELNRVEEAIELSKEAINLCDTTENVSIYTDRLINLSACYSKANRPKDALRIIKNCYNLSKDKLGLDNNQTLTAANNLATCYGELGYYDEAKKILLEIAESAEKNTDKNGEILGSIYNNIGMYYALYGNDLNMSLNYFSKAYEIRKNLLGKNNLSTIESLYNKGRSLLELGHISESVECIKKALNQTKVIVGEKNLRYIEKMKVLSYIYVNAGDLNRALEMSEDRLTLLKGVVSEKHTLYLETLEDLVELYFYTNDTLKLHNTLIEASTNYRKMIISDFPNYTSTERANVVGGMERFFDWLFPLVCYFKQQPDICSEYYNALLLRKGILLNSEIEFSRLIRESGDTVLISRYDELIMNKNLLNRQYQLPIEQRFYNIDSLKHAIYEIEDYLVSASKDYGDFTERFRTSWKDIREKLKDGELSVEFVEFYDTCTIQNRVYYALVIDNHSMSPELVPLCTEKDILEIMNSNNEEGLYKIIWDPIFQKKENVKIVYFSPSGILNNIGIEYLYINDYENISDNYSLYRLSSTREIIEKRVSSLKSAVLYGGLDYSVDTEVLLAQNNKSELYHSSSIIYRGLSDSLSVRNSFEPLYNTKTEITEIEKTLKKGTVSVSTYSDTIGTEESFKELSGERKNLIHLATHGMYIGVADAESRKKDANLSFILFDENERGHIQEDNSLSRSFLVMSGGDMLPSHKSIPDNLEDGILTATEISKLDLRGLDLVVLSACQTALGDVDNEGVYGLQRGFKKAGANTILMSLDKVDDEATKILMVEFYKNLMSGKTKHQSLKDAQKYLRQVDNGKYDKPEYWASFIMLDGLN